MPEPPADKPLVLLRSQVSSPPLSVTGRIRIGRLLRRLQRGESLGLPESRPLPMIGPRCHELRVVDRGSSWRVVYRVDVDTIVVAEVFRKTTRKTPESAIQTCRQRFAEYDLGAGERGW
jgi:phage-related protein